MSGLFDDDNSEPTQRVPPPGPQPRSRALVGTIVVLVIAFFLVSVFTGVWTDRLWFKSVDYSEVFSKVLGTKVLLFVVFGLLMAVAVGANVVLAYRFRPLFRPSSAEQVNLDRYREVVDPLRRWLVIGLAIVLGLFAGGSGSGQWRQYLLWRHGGSFGTTDANFHKDVGFYVFDLPWLHYLVGLRDGRGGAEPARRRRRALPVRRDPAPGQAGPALRRRAGADLGAGRAVRAVQGRRLLARPLRPDHRTAAACSPGSPTPTSNAVLPAKTILTFIAIICALLFFANVLRRTWLLPSVGLGPAGAVLDPARRHLARHRAAVPGQALRARQGGGRTSPRNIKATREAYGIADTKVTQYDAKLDPDPGQLQSDASSIPGVRLLDPALVVATRSSSCSRSAATTACRRRPRRRPLPGQRQASATWCVAVRELDQTGLPDSQRNWANEHTVYTHGYGVVAAYGNQRTRRPAGQRRQAGLGRAGPAAGRGADRHAQRLPAADLLRREEPGLLDRRQAPSGKPPSSSTCPESSGAAAGEDEHLRRAAAACRSAACSTSCCTP